MAARGGVAEALEGLIEGLGGVTDVLVLPAAAPEGLPCDRPLGRLGYCDGFLAAAASASASARLTSLSLLLLTDSGFFIGLHAASGAAALPGLSSCCAC